MALCIDYNIPSVLFCSRPPSKLIAHQKTVKCTLLLLLIVVAVIVIGLGVGFGVGLGRGTTHLYKSIKATNLMGHLQVSNRNTAVFVWKGRIDLFHTLSHTHIQLLEDIANDHPTGRWVCVCVHCTKGVYKYGCLYNYQ